MHRRTWKTRVVCLLGLLGDGCSPGAARLPADHPASPSAPVGPVGDPGAGSERPAGAPPAAVAAAPSTHGHGGHQDASHMARMSDLREQLRAKLGAAYEAEVPGLDAASAERGDEAFRRLCIPCHGPAGKGDGPASAGLDPPPADLTDPEHARFYSDAGRLEIIRGGSPGTAMAGFGEQLSPPELLDLYAYVRTLRGDLATPPGGHHAH